jgi:hypothetical protein
MKTTFPLILSALAACQGPPGSAAPKSDARIEDSIDATVLDAAPGDAGPPDLTVVPERTIADLSLRRVEIPADSCMLDPDEACVGASGERDLLRFTVETPNVGESDLYLGIPAASNPHFKWSDCHGHFHFQGYASYELVDSSDQTVVVGRKQAFCLVDSERYQVSDEVPTQARYYCGDQGLSRGWTDVYLSDLPCQFVDVTDVPDGNYTLRIHVNPEGALEDARSDNNLIEVPVQLGDAALTTPTEACRANAPRRAIRRESRECGWDEPELVSCTPGLDYRIGCAQACGVGSCSGDPMLRVCDSTTDNCTLAAALGHSNDRCGAACPFVDGLVCPESGAFHVYAASFEPGAAFECTIELSEEPGFP